MVVTKLESVRGMENSIDVDYIAFCDCPLKLTRKINQFGHRLWQWYVVLYSSIHVLLLNMHAA